MSTEATLTLIDPFRNNETRKNYIKAEFSDGWSALVEIQNPMDAGSVSESFSVLADLVLNKPRTVF